jgi:hypothetical protein
MADANLQSGQEPRTRTRSDPRSLTLADMMSIIAGAAVGVALLGTGRFALPVAPYLPPLPLWFPILLLCSWCLLTLGASTSFAVIGRQMAFRRPAFAAEWLSILLALSLFKETVPSVDGLVNRWFPYPWVSTAFGQCEWILAGAGLFVALLGILVLAWGHRVCAPWAKTVLLAASLFLLLWLPLEVLARDGSVLFPAPPERAPRWIIALATEIRVSIGRLPTGLVYAIPAVATLLQWKARGAAGRKWTEWPGPVVALLLGLFYLVSLYVLRGEWPPDRLYAERAIVPVGILGLALLGWFLVNRLGPSWSKWFA